MQPTNNRTKRRHEGIVVPMVTPFTREGDLDEAAVGRLVDHMIAGGVTGIFVLGTTGEAASMPLKMRSRLVRTIVERVNGGASVYVGIGDNCVSDSVEMAQAGLKLGVDAVVAHLPAYYFLNPKEMFDYYALLSERIDGPLVLYNMPATTRMSIPVEIVATLSRLSRIVALKDSENDVARLEQIVHQLGKRDDFSLLVGASGLSARGLRMGMDGVVPSTANLFPRLWSDLYQAAKRDDFVTVDQIQSQLNRVARVLQQERTLGQAVAALKTAMSIRGLCEPSVLPPLNPLTAEQTRKIRDELDLLVEAT